MTSTAPADAVRVSLRARVLRASSWAVGGQIASQIVRLASNIVLARMLAPDAFGLMSIIYMLTVALTLFSDLGINRTLVQSARGTDPMMLDTAWTLQVIRGGGLTVATLLLALGFFVADRFQLIRAGTVYADPRLPGLIAVFALGVLFTGFESIRVSQARRNVHLAEVTAIETGSQVAGAVFMVTMAWLTHSIWSLVAGALVSSSVRIAVGYAILPGHRERFHLEKEAVQELMKSGRWIFLSSILAFAALNGDRVLMGGLTDTASFGLYAVAFLLASVMQVMSNTLSGTVAYPALAEVFRERPDDLPRTLARFQQAYDALLLTAAGLLAVAAPTIVGVLYDARYAGAGWMLSVLAVSSIGYRFQMVEQCYQATGNPQLTTLANFLRVAALGTGMLVGHHLAGLFGLIVGIAVSQFAGWPLAIWFLARRHALTWRANCLVVPALVLGCALGWLASAALTHLHAGHLRAAVHAGSGR